MLPVLIDMKSGAGINEINTPFKLHTKLHHRICCMVRVDECIAALSRTTAVLGFTREELLFATLRTAIMSHRHAIAAVVGSCISDVRTTSRKSHAVLAVEEGRSVGAAAAECLVT